MAHDQNTNNSLNLFVVLIVALAVISLVIGLVMFFNTSTKEQGDKIKDTAAATERSRYSQFDNTEVRGEDILTLIQQNQGADFGVIVVTKKEGSFANGHNYLRPIGASVTEANSDNPKMPGVYKNTLTAKGLGSKDEWESAAVIEGSFASDDRDITSSNLKFAKKSGHKSQIIERAIFETKLIMDSNKVIGVIGIQKGTL